VIWLTVTVAVLVWIVSEIAVATSPHEAGDAGIALVVWMPQILAGVVGIVVLAGLGRHRRWAGWLGLIWAMSEVLIALAGASRLIGLAVSIVTEGRRVSWDPTESALVFSTASAADWTHWQDFLALALLIVAIIGAAAAIVLLERPRSGAFDDRRLHA
jgi:hypothetical protein